MANLIITIISIALVAILAIMGIFYGGSAFQAGQAKSIANRLIQEANQISGAILLYRTNTGQDFVSQLTDGSEASMTTLLVPNYLSSFPSLPDDGLVTYSLPGWNGQKLKWQARSCGDMYNTSAAGGLCMITPIFIGQIVTQNLGLQVCQQLSMINRNTTWAKNYRYQNGDPPQSGTLPATSTVDCFADANDWNLASVDVSNCNGQTAFCTMFFAFRVY